MPAGRPLYYTDPIELQAKVAEYFEKCDDGEEIKVYSKKKQEIQTIHQRIPYTVPGLANYIGFNSRQSLLNYIERAKKEDATDEEIEIMDTIIRAKARIEQQRVERALTGEQDARVAQFDLKNNFDYREVIENKMDFAPLQVIVRRYGELEGEEQGRLESGGNALITDGSARSGGEQTP